MYLPLIKDILGDLLSRLEAVFAGSVASITATAPTDESRALVHEVEQLLRIEASRRVGT